MEKPIFFNAEMVRAILDGRKTQTRRIVKQAGAPPCMASDTLWVRETHWMDRRDTTLAVMDVDGFVVAQNGRETGEKSDLRQLGSNHFWNRRPSIHMPRWASRITLHVDSVRVERLLDITDAEAMAEGVPNRTEFMWLWRHIYGPQSWIDNPLVWVIEFKRTCYTRT